GNLRDDGERIDGDRPMRGVGVLEAEGGNRGPRVAPLDVRSQQRDRGVADRAGPGPLKKRGPGPQTPASQCDPRSANRDQQLERELHSDAERTPALEGRRLAEE